MSNVICMMAWKRMRVKKKMPMPYIYKKNAIDDAQRWKEYFESIKKPKLFLFSEKEKKDE